VGKGAAAYRAAENIKSEYNGRTHNYTRKSGIVHKEIILPDNAPADFADRSVLWNSVEQIDRNSNAQLAREIEFALPVELNMEQNIALAREYVKKHFTDKGMIADICIHDKQDGNPHCHVMLSLRPLNENGTWGAKSRKEYILDHNGERIRLPNKISKSGAEILGEWKSRKVNATDWNDNTKAEEWRKGWADTANATFERLDMTERIDHRSYERQGNGLTPTIHLSHVAHRMEQRGIRTEKGDYNRRVHSLNSEIKQTKARICKLKNDLYKHPVQNPPSIVEIMGNVGKGKNLKTDWQRIRSLQTQAKVLIFLQENHITSVEDFADTIVRKNEQLKTVADDIKKAERRLETLAVHLAHAENNRQHKAVYQKYKSLAPKTDPAALNSINPFTKSKATKEHDAATKKQDEYYSKHADAIQAYQAAQTYFAGVMNGRTTLPIKDWQNEQKELAAKRYVLCDEYYDIKAELPNMEAIRRSMETLMRDEPNRGQPALVRGQAL